MIVFRQKEYSDWLTKLSYGIEKMKESMKKINIDEVRLRSQQKALFEDPKAFHDKTKTSDPKLDRVANIAEHRHPTRSETQIKRDSIKTREEIKDYSKNPKKVVKKVAKKADDTIHRTIRKPKKVLIKAATKFLPGSNAIGGEGMVSAAISDSILDDMLSNGINVGNDVNLGITSRKSIQKRLNNTARKYRRTNFSKRLGGRMK